ncbi:MAG: RHS repeat protein [Clostridiales bacterium]|nr:RHS repeat protein [Clostridiales bacterium]
MLFAKDGEVYDFDGKRCVAIGGAYSVDKQVRLAQGWGWWPDEQHDEAGNRASTAYPDGTAASCEYDLLDRLVALTDAEGEVTIHLTQWRLFTK